MPGWWDRMPKLRRRRAPRDAVPLETPSRGRAIATICAAFAVLVQKPTPSSIGAICAAAVPQQPRLKTAADNANIAAQAVCAVYTGQTGSSSPASNQTAGKAAQQASVSQSSDTVSADGASDDAGPAGVFPWLYGYEVVRELPHQADAFTQGLEFDKRCAKTPAGDGFECTDIFWESTGKPK